MNNVCQTWPTIWLCQSDSLGTWLFFFCGKATKEETVRGTVSSARWKYKSIKPLHCRSESECSDRDWFIKWNYCKIISRLYSKTVISWEDTSCYYATVYNQSYITVFSLQAGQYQQNMFEYGNEGIKISEEVILLSINGNKIHSEFNLSLEIYMLDICFRRALVSNTALGIGKQWLHQCWRLLSWVGKWKPKYCFLFNFQSKCWIIKNE